jgi:DNA-binding NtrC family response regulator
MYVLSSRDELPIDALPNNILMAGRVLEAGKPLEVQIPANGFDLKGHLRELEKAYFLKAIEICDGNRAKAAGLLKINEHAFRRRAREDFNI